MLQVLVVDQTSVTFVHHMRLAAPYLLRGLATHYLLRRLAAPYLLRGLATPYLPRGYYSLVIASGPKVSSESVWFVSIGGELIRSCQGVRSELVGFHLEVFESRSEVVEPHPKVVESRPEVVESRLEVVESRPELIVKFVRIKFHLELDCFELVRSCIHRAHPELYSSSLSGSLDLWDSAHFFQQLLKDIELETLIATYDIPLDLRPCLPDPNFRMINLPAGDTTIGIYSRIFDSSGLRIPFSSFLLAVLKYFKVHISQLVPLGYGREEPHGLDTSILSRVVDRTTSPALAGTAVPHASLEEVSVTRPDRKVVTKADHATKRKASTRPEISTNAAKKTRSSKKGSGARSSGQTARDKVEQADDRTLDDDDQHDSSEIALEGIESLNDVSQGLPGPAFARLMEAAPASDAQPLDADVGADEIASDDNVDPYYEARVGNTVGDVLERYLLLIVLGPYYISYPYDEVVVVDGGDGGLKGCLVPWFLKLRSPKIPTLSGEIRLEKVNHYDHDGVGENANHENFGLDNLQIGCNLLQDYTTFVTPSQLAYTPPPPFLATMEPLDSFLMGDEVISNISSREINEFVKSSVDDPIPVPRESEVTSDKEYVVDFLMENEDVAGLPGHLVKRLFSHLVINLSSTRRMSDKPLEDDSKPISYDVTFSNSLFDIKDDYTLCYDNPLFDDEFEEISSLDPLNIDLLLGENLDTLSTGDREIDFNPIRDIEEIKRLLADDPVPVPRVFDEPLGNSDLTSRSSETSDLFEELVAEFGLDDSIPTEIDDRYHDLEGDILYFEQLLNKDTSSDVSLALLPTESSSLDLPLPDPKQIYSREVEIFEPFFSQTQSGRKTRVMETPCFSSHHMPLPCPATYSPTKCQLITHRSMLNARYDHSLRNVERLSKHYAQQMQTIKKQSADLKQQNESIVRAYEGVFRKHRNERDTLAIEKAKIEEELVKTKSQLEHHERFLKSGEFNRAFSGVLNTSINVLVEQGLRMDRFNEEFSDLFQRVIGFIPDAKEKFNRVVAAFSDTTFSFLDKVSQSSQSSLQDIARLEPDRVTPSHQTSSATASLRANTDVRHFTSSSGTFGHTSTPDHLKKKKKPVDK
uniref:Transposase (Putative), gypsy type n=1 Tax=Tanacetum cinerariifolium TaxID=118510 RepID=A0A6L2KEL9_TANCI|nr:hypothetical protein [Tanacetum cinerariifolium]